ncbi:MAG: lysophospholipid acyltransferase family protein [Chthoniobacterales bacterium]|nr:lysophospholipid acyltransferase family protein [Chthoniobacterales bacterium]
MSTPRERIEHAALVAAAWIMARLPFGTLRPLATALGSLVYGLDPRGRAVAHENIEAAFPGKYSPAQKIRIARGSYITFARTMFELFWAPNLNEKFFEEHVIFEGWDGDYVRKDPSRPAIYACFHYGNFEWLALAGSYTISPGPVIAQRFKNSLIGPVFDRLRASTGNQVIPQERAMIRMLKYLKGGGKFGMLCDLNLDPREGSVLVECFGGLLASVTQTHAALAQRTGAAIVPVACLPGPNRKYRIVHYPPIECPPEADPAAIVQRCWNALESAVHAHPECWLWAYKHWRFKPEANNARYPSYANRSKRFDKLVRKRIAPPPAEPPADPQSAA